jgi:hypothetical protein
MDVKVDDPAWIHTGDAPHNLAWPAGAMQLAYLT